VLFQSLMLDYRMADCYYFYTQLVEGCARIHAKATLMFEIERKGKFQMLLAIMAI